MSANSNSAAQKYKYNGKELNDELGLDWYDYGARNYDASLGRWMNLDPLAENYYYDSPYVYTTNNPVLYLDPDGRYWIDNKDGTWTAEAGDSASTLAEDANISFEKAKEIMANTKKSNSSLGNMGTYIDPKDGVEKSAVDEGDVVLIPEQVNAIVQETKLKQEEAKLDGEIAKVSEEMNTSIAAKDKFTKQADSLEQEWLNMMNDPKNKPQPGDPGGGFTGVRIIKGTRLENMERDKKRKADSVDKVILKQSEKLKKLKNKKKS